MDIKFLKYNSLEELNSEVKVPEGQPDMLAKSAPKVLSKARKLSQSDLEMAYVLYMRYVDLVMFIRKTPLYAKDKTYFDCMLNPKDTKLAMAEAEKLDKILSELYRKKKQKEKEIPKEARDFAITVTQLNAAKPEVKVNENAIEQLVFIEPTNILNLINEKSTSFLIIDVRPSTDFEASHVDHSNVLSVPSEFLKPGSTPKTIERQLRHDSRFHWSRRGRTNKLIIMDWKSEKFPEPRDESPLAILKDALLRWDTEDNRSLPLYICSGGFENFGMQYPMHVTNSKFVKAPTEKKKKTDLFGFNDIKYPDLDNAFIASPSPAPSSNTSLESNGPLYPSTSDLANPAILSGAITINGKPAAISVRQPNPPNLPDRSTKPTHSVSKLPYSNGFDVNDQDGYSTTGTANSSVNSLISELNNARIESDSSIDSERQVPAVDRSLKAKMILKGSKKEIKEVIEAEQDLVEDTLQLDKFQLDLESRWEVLRLRREKCAEETKRAEAQKNEELLIEEIHRMTEERAAKDLENQRLRDQLRELKEQLNVQTFSKPLSEQIKNLELAKAEVEENERKTKEEVAKKRDERIKKLKEEQVLAEKRVKEAEKSRIEAQRELEERKRIHNSRDVTPVKRVPLKNEEEPKSNLNRSHSSPNIAQMDDDEEIITSTRFHTRPMLPVFSRTNKPKSSAEISQARSRDFQTVWCSNKGLTGLRNLGNTCYMNSILQCLSNIKLLASFFTENKYSLFVNERSATKGDVAIEFAEVVRKLWQDNIRSISPSDFKRTIGIYKECFRGNEQQDAHELLVTLMEWLNNDVNEVKVKVTLPEQKNEGLSPEEAALRAWESEQRADKSFIRELFYGQWRSSLTCKTCHWESVKYESFFELSLPLPGGNNGRLSIEDCIETCLMPENVNYTCPRCKTNRVCQKKFDIVKLPMVLTVQFVRFYNDGLWRKKQNFIDFKLTGMNFGKHATACGGKMNRYTNYNLFAVCNHFGSMEGGHYTAYCLSERYMKWFKYDDHEVTEMEPRDVVTPAAYVLFFSAISSRQ